MAKAIPWDEQTDLFIDDLNETLSNEYSINLRSLLMSPEKYLNKKGIGDTIKGMKEEVDSYFSKLLDGLKSEQEQLEKDLENATAQYKQVDAVISNKSAASRVPYVRPMLVNRNQNSEETIVVEQYSDNLDAFIGKLVGASNYVADLSTEYKGHFIGSWLFSGNRNYVLAVNPPVSPILVIENSRGVINDILTDIADRATG